MLLDGSLQASAGTALRLKLFGNLLFVAADSGVVVLNISDPLHPKIISAGNSENIEAVDFFKDRLVTVGSVSGLSAIQLPGSMVVESNVKEGGFLAAAATYTVSFNEPMTLDSMQKSGVVQVTRMDTNAEIPVTVTADTQVNSAAEKFGLVFERVSGVTYKVAINGAFNLRGTGQWAEFVEHFTQANELAIQPVINTVENGSYHRDNQQAIRILGTGFRNSADVKVFVDQFPVSVHWVNDQLIGNSCQCTDFIAAGDWAAPYQSAGS